MSCMRVDPIRAYIMNAYIPLIYAPLIVQVSTVNPLVLKLYFTNLSLYVLATARSLTTNRGRENNRKNKGKADIQTDGQSAYAIRRI